MKGRILMLTSGPPDRVGGAERFVREMWTRCEAEGYVVQVFHAGNSLPALFRGRRSRSLRPLLDALLGYYVGRCAEKQLNDEVVAIISNGPVGWYPFRIRNASTKRIHFYHGTYWGVADAIRPFITRHGYFYLKWGAAMLLERRSGSGKLLLCNSEQTKEEISKRFHLACHTVWLPMDTKRFVPHDMLACRQFLKLPQNEPIGLFAGSLEPHKGFSTVRALMDSFPEVHWVLLVRSRRPSDLDSCPKVTILNNLSDEVIPQLYASATFAICASLYEPFGYVVAEALACGTPMVSSPTGASRLFLREPPLDQLLIERPEDIDGFRRAVAAVLSAPEFYRQIVLTRIRPKIEAIMSPEAWWQRVSEVTGL